MPFPENVTGAVMRLTIHRGNDLLAKDRRIFAKNTSDPYVTVVSSAGRELCSTQVIPKSVHPVWDRSFNLELKRDELDTLRSFGRGWATEILSPRRPTEIMCQPRR